jgi:hypothetical protein
MPDEEFIAPDPDEPIPEPPPEGATDAGLGGVEVSPEQMDFAEQEFIGELLGLPAAAVAGAPTWGQVYTLAKAQLAAVVHGRIHENVNPFTIWYYGTSAIAAAWCFIFISWCLAHAAKTANAGLALLGGKYAFVPWINRIGGFRSGHSGMRVGAIVAVSSFNHIGFCTAISGSTFHLLSGNSTSSSGSDAITVKSYSVSVISGYVNLAYATIPTPTPTPTPTPQPAEADDVDEWVS